MGWLLTKTMHFTAGCPLFVLSYLPVPFILSANQIMAKLSRKSAGNRMNGRNYCYTKLGTEQKSSTVGILYIIHIYIFSFPHIYSYVNHICSMTLSIKKVSSHSYPVALMFASLDWVKCFVDSSSMLAVCSFEIPPPRHLVLSWLIQYVQWILPGLWCAVLYSSESLISLSMCQIYLMMLKPYVWCWKAVCMVYVWCRYGSVCMVYVWCMYGAAVCNSMV